MAYETGGWPTAYEIIPGYDNVKRVAEVAKRLGRFLFTTPEAHPYMSEHFRPEYPPEPTDGEAAPSQKELTAAHYVAMARQAEAEA